MPDIGNSADDEVKFTVLPTGDSCEKCNSTDNVLTFKGKDLCKGCRNQLAAMN